MKLGDLVKQYIIFNGYDTTHNYPRLYQVAIAGLKNVSYDVSGAPTYKVLELDQHNTSDVPEGLIKIREIFMASRGGRIPINEAKMNPQTTDQGTVTDAVEQFIPQPFTENGFSGNTSPDEISKHWKNGEFTGGVFAGNPTGNPYTYQRNYDTNKLEFSSNVQGTVMVEYIGSPQVQGNDFCIHPFLEEPLMYWLEWKDRAFKDRVGVGDKMRLRKQYHDAKRWAKMQFNSRSPQEIRNKQRKGYSLTPS